MSKVSIDIKLTPEQVAQQLWAMDTREIANVFVEWNNIIIANSEDSAKNRKLNFWHNLCDVFVWMNGEYELNSAFRELTRNLYVSSLVHEGMIPEKSFDTLTKDTI
jgi:hypothetical protein